jgi:uncharacterized membrane protein (DUF106 family)
MKNLRLKISLLLIITISVTTIFTLVENTKTIDFVPVKNKSYYNSSLNEILKIQDVETRKAEGEIFLNQLNKKHSNDQESNAKIFSLLSSNIFICIVCVIIIFIDLFKKQ